MVEGEHDERYVKLAARLYHRETGRHLLGRDLVVFTPGIGENGGADALQRNFPVLRGIMDVDLTPEGKNVYRAIVLLDQDSAGLRGSRALTGSHSNYKLWRDVFLLCRKLPRHSRDLVQLTRSIEANNAPWKGMECEIEDLVDIDLLEEFLRQNPGAAVREIERRADGHHCFLRPHYKGQLVRFVEKNAQLRDVSVLVEVLKSLRYHLGLPDDREMQ